MQLCPIFCSQSLHFPDTISTLSPAISPPPQKSSSISNQQQTFDCILAAAALTAMINPLAA
jgi:hypothetical protein